MSEKYLQFHLAEYNALSLVFIQNIKDQYNSVIYSIVANAAIFAWISSNINDGNQKNILAIGACLPPLISGASWVINARRIENAKHILEYAAEMEKIFAMEGLGYRRFYKSKAPKHQIGTSTTFRLIYFLQSALALYFLYFIWMII